MQIADAKAQVVGVAGNPADLLLALVDGHVANTQASQLDRRRQSGWAAADDCDAAIDATSRRHTPTRSGCTALPGSRSPGNGRPAPSSGGAARRSRLPGTVAAHALAISPTVTRSQWHTICPPR